MEKGDTEYEFFFNRLLLEFNEVFEDENCGYRFNAYGYILPVSSSFEVELLSTIDTDLHKSVFDHLQSAYDLLIDKKLRNFHNCIAECSNALESYLMILGVVPSSDHNQTTTNVTKLLSKNPKFKNFSEGIKYLWLFACNGGFRHGAKEDGGVIVSLSEAKFYYSLTVSIISYVQLNEEELKAAIAASKGKT